jgi:hypothetical protein
MAVPSARIVYSSNAGPLRSCSRAVLAPSLLKAMNRPSGDHCGSVRIRLSRARRVGPVRRA